MLLLTQCSLAVDLSLVQDVVPSSATPPSRTTRNQSIATINSANHALRATSTSTDPLAFSLLSVEGVLAELIAPDRHTFAEWLDGLSLLRPEGNIATQETTDLINVLTEVGVKVKLLDLTGEGSEIPSGGVQVGLPPSSTDFFFAGNL